MQPLCRRSVLAMLSALPFGTAFADDAPPVRFGLTAVIVQENVAFFERWAAYLQRRINRPIQFVQRRSYREIMELIETGELDFAWVCGYPYVRQRAAHKVELLAVPIFGGRPTYRSYVIVNADSGHRSVRDLQGGVFAYSDPDSNSGYLAPRAMLQQIGARPDQFFRLTFFTYSHAETIEAVAKHMADGGAVDSYVWDFLRRVRPALTNRTRVIAHSQPFGFPPVVVGTAVDRRISAAVRSALLEMHDDPDGAELLRILMLDRFEPGTPGLYDGIAEMAERLTHAMAQP